MCYLGILSVLSLNEGRTLSDYDLYNENILLGAYLACCMQVFDALCGILMMSRSAKKYENDVVA